MIPQSVVDKIRALLGEGLSHRQIGRLTGVCRGTVGAIASGKRRDHERLAQEEPFKKRLKKVSRCPTCGGLVRMPCSLCRVRAAIAQGKRPRQIPKPLPNDSLTVNLGGEQLARYEEVRSSQDGRAVQESLSASACDIHSQEFLSGEVAP